MAKDRELTTVYLILAKSFVETVPYDAQGGFILLHSITVGLGDATPGFLDTASHLHMLAALEDSDMAGQTARLSMARLISIMERRLMPGIAPNRTEPST